MLFLTCKQCLNMFLAAPAVEEALSNDPSVEEAELFCGGVCMERWVARLTMQGYYDVPHPTLPEVDMRYLRCYEDRKPPVLGLCAE